MTLTCNNGLIWVNKTLRLGELTKYYQPVAIRLCGFQQTVFLKPNNGQAQSLYRMSILSKRQKIKRFWLLSCPFLPFKGEVGQHIPRNCKYLHNLCAIKWQKVRCKLAKFSNAESSLEEPKSLWAVRDHVLHPPPLPPLLWLSVPLEQLSLRAWITENIAGGGLEEQAESGTWVTAHSTVINWPI